MLRAPGQGRGVAVPWVWEGGPDVGSEGGPEPGFLRAETDTGQKAIKAQTFPKEPFEGW